MLTLATVKTLLTADATLMATATGGVWTFDDTGRLGLNRTLTPGAFDATGIVKPTVLLKARGAQPDYSVADDAGQVVAVRQVVEVWFYQDSGFAAIETMRDRVYRLLHAKRVAGVFALRWDGDIRNQRDVEMDANVERSSYLVHSVRRAT